MTEFTKETLIAEVLDILPNATPFFTSIGMHCLTCAMASGETLGEACEVHGIDADKFVSALNQFAALQ